MIIVIDISNSFTLHTLGLTKSAAKSVIDTLGLNDFIGVVTFSSNAKILKFTTLERATESTRNMLKL